MVEQVKAHRVADGPVVEVAAPAVHLCRRHPRRVVDEARQQTRFVPAGVPECRGQFVVLPQVLGVLSQCAHRHAKRLVGHDRKARHAVAVGLGAMLLQPIQYVLHLVCHVVCHA